MSDVHLGVSWPEEDDFRTGRDAVHIAVIVAQAGAKLEPGQAVTMREGVAWPAGQGDERDAVVDPFLRRHVERGHWCYLLVQPFSVRDLRHDWTHPAFPRARPDFAAMSEAERWLRDFAREHHVDYEEMVDGAVSGQGVIFGLEFHPGAGDELPAEFWDKLETVTGRTFDRHHIEETTKASGCGC